MIICQFFFIFFLIILGKNKKFMEKKILQIQNDDGELMIFKVCHLDLSAILDIVA
jgi:hypothetical protein